MDVSTAGKAFTQDAGHQLLADNEYSSTISPLL